MLKQSFSFLLSFLSLSFLIDIQFKHKLFKALAFLLKFILYELGVYNFLGCLCIQRLELVNFFKGEHASSIELINFPDSHYGQDSVENKEFSPPFHPNLKMLVKTHIFFMLNLLLWINNLLHRSVHFMAHFSKFAEYNVPESFFVLAPRSKHVHKSAVNRHQRLPKNNHHHIYQRYWHL